MKRITQRQNETPITTKALDKHLSEKVTNQGVVLVHRRKSNMHKADEQHALPPTVRNWSTTGSGAVIEYGGKRIRIHWQQIEVFSNYWKPPRMTKNSLSDELFNRG